MQMRRGIKIMIIEWVVQSFPVENLAAQALRSKENLFHRWLYESDETWKLEVRYRKVTSHTEKYEFPIISESSPQGLTYLSVDAL